MKTLLCVKPFGFYEPGDEIQIPDSAVFDTAYFAVKADAVDKRSTDAANAGKRASSARPSYGSKENKE